ncbi:TetR family transcriptional regulator [Actinomycetospora sp. NBRC 106375]|uniref:TetR/AcrR family transcriptional regulator n=1 Tax=Actinomycetospora sp. NBRC 106375 TaxID=3032207 RepID=UPI0024A42A28|nr:TetR/AcrR family transcriptional regulator [Actinomycetospora sp. NBRC 106375]GLZ49207.1 TetR family transcriptional regulator [Actinomycetospora sp. NBRC 106375]
MGQPAEELSFIERARRTQIIGAAAATIAEDGIGQASLARIAKRAGVSKGVVSYHFAGKDDLMKQVVLAVYEAGAAAMTPVIQAATTPRDRLAAYLRSNVAYIAANPEALQAVIEIVSGYSPEGGGRLFAPGDDEVIADFLVGLFREGQQDGSFRDFDPLVMAHTVRGAIDVIAPRHARHPEIDLEAYAEELVALFDAATRRESS